MQKQHFGLQNGGSKIHERPAHFFVDIYSGTQSKRLCCSTKDPADVFLQSAGCF